MPKPKDPTALRLLKGTNHRTMNKNEPHPRSIVPRVPSWLTGLALEEWQRVAEEVRGIPGWVTPLDRSTLMGYCQSYQRWVDAEAVLTEHGLTYPAVTTQIDTSGTPVDRITIKARPEVKIARDSKMEMLRFSQELGFGPASRSRVAAKAIGAVDDTERGLDVM